MNISLAGILSRVHSESANQTDAANAASVSHVAKNMHSAMVLDNLHAGQTISGLVRSVNGAQILLDMGNGVEIGAKLESNIDISAGKNLLFEVKSNAGGKLLLSPLHTNLSSEESAVAGALKAAGMALTETNIQMVKSMMNESMPIDKNSLWTMGKQVSAYPAASPDTIVRLQAMEMEINQENIAGFEAVQNMQHQVLYALQDFNQGLDQIFQQFISSRALKEGITFLNDMLALFPEFENQQIAEQQSINGLPQQMDEQMTNGLVTGDLQGAVEESSQQANISGQSSVSEQGPATMANNPLSGTEIQQSLTSEADSVTTLPQIKDQFLSFLQSLKGLEGDLGADQKQMIWDQFESLTKQASNWFGKALTNEWTIKPEEFSDKEVVKEFYRKITEQSGRLQDFLGNHEKIETPAGKAISAIQQNLHFLESVNQAFPYLQIPLKASMENAHGDLYVYSNKNGKVSEDGSCSALLHLEMQHLGNMDIYVKLKDQNVSTQFMLEDESVLDFLEQHMDLLTAKLEKKGYHLDTQVKQQNKQEEEDSISKIRGVSKKETLISYTSFDVRA